MKTQIITLESHDDLISVRDRMSWAKTPRILLVWPKYEKVTLRQVDLKVLQRHATSLGAQLGLVTRARRVRNDAEALKIPVFESTGQAQRVAWPKPRRRRWAQRPPRRDLREKRAQASVKEETWRTHPATRVGAFIVGVFSVLVLVALFIPSAQITLHPKAQLQSLTLPVSASPSAKSVFITGSIPAYEKRLLVEAKQTVPVTGENVTPQSKAKGTVEFHNLTKQAVSIPTGTVVRTENNIRFVTTKDGKVSAGTSKAIELPVEAVEAGLSGNADAKTIVVVMGKLATSISVTNPEPLQGGRELASPQASDADRQRAKDSLMKALASKARTQLAEEMKGGDILFEDTLAVSQIVSEVFDPPPGAPSKDLTLTMQVEFSERYASASDLMEFAALALNASVPPGFSATPQAITVTPAGTPSSTKDGSTRWTIRVERQIVQQINTARVMQLVQGVSSSHAQTLLAANLPLEGAVIHLAPSWWPWMPIVPFRISVVTK